MDLEKFSEQLEEEHGNHLDFENFSEQLEEHGNRLDFEKFKR